MTVAQFPPNRRFDGTHGPEDRRHTDHRRGEPQHGARPWLMMCVGMCATYIGMSMLVTRPLTQRMTALSHEVTSLQIGMRQLADVRDNVSATNDLLTSLNLQTERLRGARAAVEQLRRLQREVEEQAAGAEDALMALQQAAKLHAEVISQGHQLAALQTALDEFSLIEERIATITESTSQQIAGIERVDENLQQLGALKRRVAIESLGIDTAQTQLSRLVGLKKAVEHAGRDGVDEARSTLVDLADLKTQVIAAGSDMPLAQTVTDALIGLRDALSHDHLLVDTARDHADRLLALEASLITTPGADIDSAHQNLDQLIGLEQKLIVQDDTIRTAVESLELLTDLQHEFQTRIGQLEGIRRGLMELVMLESMVGRTVRALQPLADLADLQRLEGADLREIARTYLNEQGVRRLAIYDGDTPVTGNATTPSIGDERLVPLPPQED